MDELVTEIDRPCSTLEAAKRLGLAVRSVQLMVDRGELQAWKTPGGHRRISRASVEHWLSSRNQGLRPGAALPSAAGPVPDAGGDCVLVIEDSKHYQNLVKLLLGEHFPSLTVKLADDGVVGLAMAGQLQPRVLIVDILLPGIDGATLIFSLRSHPQFATTRLIVITSLDEPDRAPYRFALDGVTVVHKSQLMAELPIRMREALSLPAQAATDMV